MDAVSLCERTLSRLNHHRILHDLGRGYLGMGNINKAASVLRMARKTCYVDDYDERLAILLTESSLFYSIQDLYSVKEYSYIILKLTDQKKNHIARSSALNSLALVAIKENELDEALKYYQLALSLKNSEIGKASIFVGMAQVYFRKGLSKQALDIYIKAIQIYKENNAYALVEKVSADLKYYLH